MKKEKKEKNLLIKIKNVQMMNYKNITNQFIKPYKYIFGAKRNKILT